MLTGCVFAEEPKLRLTIVQVSGLTSEEVQVITNRVFPSPVWREGGTLVIRGSRDSYEVQEVRKRITAFTRLLVLNLESTKLPFLPTEANKVQRG